MSEELVLTSSTIDQKTLKSCIAIIAAFFPGKNIRLGTSGEAISRSVSQLRIEHKTDNPRVYAVSFMIKDPDQPEEGQLNTLQANSHQDECKGQEYNIRIPDVLEILKEVSLPGQEPLAQILVKRALHISLARMTQRRMPWGILTGIRPGKLLSKMNDMALEENLQTMILNDLYLVEEEKVSVLRNIANIQKPFLEKMKERSDLISVYLTIPFCPSRCFYCSFPSNFLTTKNRELFDSYLRALYEETRLTGEMMRDMGLKADCIYIGGGTPTTLSSSDLEKLMQIIHQYIPIIKDLEYTVEAGRPDSIDRSKLNIMRQAQVNRISINPQSMQDKTLSRIGRKHTVSDIIDCYQLAREMSDWIINMDLILGLPDEVNSDMLDSLQRVLTLRPDNLTVHALALKRGSDAWEAKYEHQTGNDWISLQEHIKKKIERSDYKPYYLYRQKNIAGNLENIGYSLPGKVSRYNIAIIEEKQNIIGLGAGASSKILKRDGGHHNYYHPIDLNYYLKRFEENHALRVQALKHYIDP